MHRVEGLKRDDEMHAFTDTYTGVIISACEEYISALRGLARQVYLHRNEFMRGTALTKVETGYNRLRTAHEYFLSRMASADMFKIGGQTGVGRVEVVNFTASTHPTTNMQGEEDDNDELAKIDLPSSDEKDHMVDMETHSGFLQKVEHLEAVSIGHIYCLETIKQGELIIAGKFGTAVSSRTIDVISKINHNLERVYNIRYWQGYQIYFPGDAQIIVWKDDFEVLRLSHNFRGGFEGLVNNSSKCVYSVGSKVYFMSILNEVVEIDWNDIIKAVHTGRESLAGKKVFVHNDLTDFCIQGSTTLHYVTLNGTVGRMALVSASKPPTPLSSNPNIILPSGDNSEHREYTITNINNMKFTAIAAMGEVTIVASHVRTDFDNQLFLLDRQLQIAGQLKLTKKEAGNNPVLQLKMIKRDKDLYALCLCRHNLFFLLAVYPRQSIRQLEVLDLSRGDDKVSLNGFSLNVIESRVFLFGDFNFQLMIRLRV